MTRRPLFILETPVEIVTPLIILWPILAMVSAGLVSSVRPDRVVSGFMLGLFPGGLVIALVLYIVLTPPAKLPAEPVPMDIRTKPVELSPADAVAMLNRSRS